LTASVAIRALVTALSAILAVSTASVPILLAVIAPAAITEPCIAFTAIFA